MPTRRIAQLEEDMFEADMDLLANVAGNRIVIKRSAVTGGIVSQAMAYFRIATSVPGAWQFLLISFLTDILGIVIRGCLELASDLTSGVSSAAAMAVSGARQFAKAQTPVYAKAVKNTVASVLRQKVQIQVVQDHLTKSLQKQGWTATTQQAISSANQGLPQGEGIRAYAHHASEIKDAEDLLEQLRNEPNQTERLQKSTAKVEHYLSLLRQAHAETNYQHYTKQQQANFGQFRRMYRKAARGKGSKGHGGAYGVMAHERLKRQGSYRRDCINTAKQSMAIAKQALKFSGLGGKYQHTLSTVVGYVARAWVKSDMSNTKPTRQKYETIEKEITDGFSLSSKQTEVKGKPKLIDGIEDVDAFSPGSIAEPIAEKSLRILSSELRAFV